MGDLNDYEMGHNSSLGYVLCVSFSQGSVAYQVGAHIFINFKYAC